MPGEKLRVSLRADPSQYIDIVDPEALHHGAHIAIDSTRPLFPQLYWHYTVSEQAAPGLSDVNRSRLGGLSSHLLDHQLEPIYMTTDMMEALTASEPISTNIAPSSSVRRAIRSIEGEHPDLQCRVVPNDEADDFYGESCYKPYISSTNQVIHYEGLTQLRCTIEHVPWRNSDGTSLLRPRMRILQNATGSLAATDLDLYSIQQKLNAICDESCQITAIPLHANLVWEDILSAQETLALRAQAEFRTGRLADCLGKSDHEGKLQREQSASSTQESKGSASPAGEGCPTMSVGDCPLPLPRPRNTTTTVASEMGRPETSFLESVTTCARLEGLEGPRPSHLASLKQYLSDRFSGTSRRVDDGE